MVACDSIIAASSLPACQAGQGLDLSLSTKTKAKTTTIIV
jgi:hypothetical protein